MTDSSTERFIDSWHNSIMEGSPAVTLFDTASTSTVGAPKQTMQSITSYFSSTPKSTPLKRPPSTPSPLSQRPDKLLCDKSTPDDKTTSLVESFAVNNITRPDTGNIARSVSSNIDDFKQFILESVDQYKNDLLSHIETIKIRVDECEKSLGDQDKRIESLEQENSDLVERNTVVEGRLFRCEHFIEKLQDKVLSLETRSMRDNIVFYNIAENPSEDTFRVIIDLLATEMNLGDQISNTDLKRSHRMGQRNPNNNFPRPIVCQFDPRSCDLIMRNAFRLKGKPYRVSVQVPRPVEEKRKHLLPIFKQAKADNLKPHWSQDVLHVGKVQHKLHKPTVADINVDPTAESLKFEVKRVPPKFVSDNTFRGSSVAINTADDVIPALNAIFSDLRCARGTKNIYAYRLQIAAGLVEYFDDDGEHGTGRRILEQLRTANLTGTLVCVTRWCGKLLGPVRFSHIVDTALSVLKS